MGILEEIQSRVHDYWSDDYTPPENENAKHFLVRETVQAAKSAGITEAELDLWARVQGEPTVGVVSAPALLALRNRLRLPGGGGRFRRRLRRDAGLRGWRYPDAGT